MRKIILIVVVMMVLLTTGCVLNSDIDKYMEYTIRESNKEFPMWVDEISCINRVSYEDGKYLVYHCKFEVDHSEYDWDVVLQNIAATITSEQLEVIDEFGNMRENDISVKYTYVDKNDVYLGEFVLDFN